MLLPDIIEVWALNHCTTVCICFFINDDCERCSHVNFCWLNSLMSLTWLDPEQQHPWCVLTFTLFFLSQARRRQYARHLLMDIACWLLLFECLYCRSLCRYSKSYVFVNIGDKLLICVRLSNVMRDKVVWESFLYLCYYCGKEVLLLYWFENIGCK